MVVTKRLPHLAKTPALQFPRDKDQSSRYVACSKNSMQHKETDLKTCTLWSQAEDQLNARAAALKKKSVQNTAIMKEELKKVQKSLMGRRDQYVNRHRVDLVGILAL